MFGKKKDAAVRFFAFEFVGNAVEDRTFPMISTFFIGTELCQSLAEPSFCTWYMSKYREGYFVKVTNVWYSLGQR